jgi:hypothetical protein
MDTSKWMEWTNLMLLSKNCLHRRTHLNEWSEQSWCFCPRFVYAVGHVYMNEVNKAYVSVQDFKLCSLHSCRRVRRSRQILDRNISFVHFIHVDVSDGVDKSWTETSALFTSFMWTKLMLLSKICLHRQTRLHEWSEQSWCFCPRFVYTVGHIYMNEVNKVDASVQDL